MSFPVLSFAAHPAAAKADPHLKPGSEGFAPISRVPRHVQQLLRHWRKGRRPWRTCFLQFQYLLILLRCVLHFSICSSLSSKNSRFCQGTRHQEAVNFRVSQQCCSSDLLQSRSILQIAMSRRERKELNTPNRMLQDLNFIAAKHERTTACECDQMFYRRRLDPSLQPLVELKLLKLATAGQAAR